MPIIVGVHRSGTTLLRMMLDAHPLLAIPPETHFLIKLLSSTNAPMTGESFLGVIQSTRNWVDFKAIESTFVERIASLQSFSLATGLRIFYETYAAQFDKPRYGDKTPRYLTIADKIQAILPEAHFIHLIRDGRDVALSSRNLWFGPGDNIEAQARNWLEKITQMRFQARSLANYLEVKYENLILNPEATLTEICQFLSLPYEAAMEHYYENAALRLREFKDHLNPDGTVYASGDQRREIHKLASSPPDAARVFAWQTELTKQDQAKFEDIAGELLKALGYETRR
jgi:hypothetical protein